MIVIIIMKACKLSWGCVNANRNYFMFNYNCNFCSVSSKTNKGCFHWNILARTIGIYKFFFFGEVEKGYISSRFFIFKKGNYFSVDLKKLMYPSPSLIPLKKCHYINLYLFLSIIQKCFYYFCFMFECTRFRIICTKNE